MANYDDGDFFVDFDDRDNNRDKEIVVWPPFLSLLVKFVHFAVTPILCGHLS